MWWNFIFFCCEFYVKLNFDEEFKKFGNWYLINGSDEILLCFNYKYSWFVKSKSVKVWNFCLYLLFKCFVYNSLLNYILLEYIFFLICYLKFFMYRNFNIDVIFGFLFVFNESLWFMSYGGVGGLKVVCMYCYYWKRLC